MSQAVAAYGSITVVDITDVGQLSVQPTSNLPISVIYDPDQNQYNPSWSNNSPLLITPIVYYGGVELNYATNPNLQIEWQRQENDGAITSLESNQTKTATGALQVTENKFSATVSLLTYRVTARYNQPLIGKTLMAQGQITFSLIRNAGVTRRVTITGDAVFKYNTAGVLIGDSSIILTALTTNVNITEWQYENANHAWVRYPGSGITNTCVINASDSTFFNDKCAIKVVTDDSNTYDIHIITKLHDGAPGTTTISAVLSNDDQMIPFNGNPPVGDFSLAHSQITIYNGGVNVTDQWTIEQIYNQVTATPSTVIGTNDRVSVTGFTGIATSGSVIFNCTKTGETPITKTFSLTKISSGENGQSPTIYSIEPSALAVNKTIDGVYSPTTITISSYSQIGQVKSVYQGRFKILIGQTVFYQSQQNQEYGTCLINCSSLPSNTKEIVCKLYEAGGTTNQLDSQTIVITNDGETGDSAVNVILGNYADVLSCTNENKLITNQTITIPFAAYEGTRRIDCDLLNQLTPPFGTISVVDGDATRDGLITWTINAGTLIEANSVSHDPSGILNLSFIATTSKGDTVTVQEKYSWSRNSAAADGENAVLLQIFTPNSGNIFSPSVTMVTLESLLLDGSQEKTASAYQWYKFQEGKYALLIGETNSSIDVYNSTVDSYASYKLQATYNNKNYYAYYSVFDKTDPLQVTVLSSVGTQLVNGNGVGAIYVKVTRNGSEIDELKSDRFLYENPSSAVEGDYYYKLSIDNKTVTLMEYKNSEWIVSSHAYTGSYNWVWRDKDSNPITEWADGLLLPTSGKVIYIDGDMINQKIIGDVIVRFNQ